MAPRGCSACALAAAVVTTSEPELLGVVSQLSYLAGGRGLGPSMGQIGVDVVMGSSFLVRRGTLVLLAALFVARGAQAQTNDHMFRSWDWSLNQAGPEGMGAAGAFVAVPDRASAVAVNPAVLGSLGRTEVFAAASLAGSGNGIDGDTVDRAGHVLLVGGGGMLTPDVAIGGFIGQPRSSEATFAPTSLGFDRSDAGFQRSSVTDVGGGVAWKQNRLHLGAQVLATHLFLEGESRDIVGGAEQARAGTSAGDTRVSLRAGGLLRFSETVAVGVTAATGASWKAGRTSALGDSTMYEVRRPSVYSTGASCQASRNVLLMGQVDFVRYSEISSSLSKVRAVSGSGQYALADAIEPRLGAEVAIAASNSLSVVLRAGVRRQASGALRFTGTDTIEAAAFAGRDARVLISGGASAVVRGVRLDLAAEAGGDGTVLAAGAGLRF